MSWWRCSTGLCGCDGAALADDAASIVGEGYQQNLRNAYEFGDLQHGIRTGHGSLPRCGHRWFGWHGSDTCRYKLSWHLRPSIGAVEGRRPDTSPAAPDRPTTNSHPNPCRNTCRAGGYGSARRQRRYGADSVRLGFKTPRWMRRPWVFIRVRSTPAGPDGHGFDGRTAHRGAQGTRGRVQGGNPIASKLIGVRIDRACVLRAGTTWRGSLADLWESFRREVSVEPAKRRLTYYSTSRVARLRRSQLA